MYENELRLITIWYAKMCQGVLKGKGQKGFKAYQDFLLSSSAIAIFSRVVLYDSSVACTLRREDITPTDLTCSLGLKPK